jgi:hypothetical protein
MSDTNVSRVADLTRVPVYVVKSGELVLDGPLKKAYPHVLNYPSWQNYTSIEHVSGKPGKEGELVILKKEEEGFSFPPYYARTIKIEPESRLIWKTYPVEKGLEDFFGIVDFQLFPQGDKTRFCYNALYEFQVDYQSESEIEKLRTEQYKNFEALFAAVFPKLRQLVSGG